jgi:hypothetical protein
MNENQELALGDAIKRAGFAVLSRRGRPSLSACMKLVDKGLIRGKGNMGQAW